MLWFIINFYNWVIYHQTIEFIQIKKLNTYVLYVILLWNIIIIQYISFILKNE